MTKHFCCISAVLLCIAASAFSQDSLFLVKMFHSPSGESMPYRLFVPCHYSPAERYPLVLWLHGSNGRGDDNIRQITIGNELGSHVWALDSNQQKFPCFVLAPQCPDTALWVANDGIDRPPDELDIALEVLGDVVRHYSIDTMRMYAAGQSMGGVAVWELIARYPAKFAAALPLCGIGNPHKAKEMTDVAIWTFHGRADSSVPVARTREMIAAIRKKGGHPRYSEYPGIGHDVWNVAFKEPELLPWVFQQRRK